MDYKEKYLKYKLKYLELKKLIGGTDFVTLYNDINLTNAHLEELYDNKPELFKTSNTLDGLKKIMDILESGKFSNGKSFPFGVKNKSIQPKWYTENPTLFTIVKDKELLKKFKTELNEYYIDDESYVPKEKIISVGGKGKGKGTPKQQELREANKQRNIQHHDRTGQRAVPVRHHDGGTSWAHRT